MSRYLSALAVAVLMTTFPAAVLAEADGPDFFRVTGVMTNDVLNIREASSASSRKVGEIPHDGDGIRNLGCEGGLTYARWSDATKAEREAAAKRRWCRISYNGAEGWAAGRFLAEGNAPMQGVARSFDCAKADNSAEEAVCDDPRLARLDVELSRLYQLALNGPNMSSDRLRELKSMQRGWIKGRDDCWKSDVGLNGCIAGSYAIRIDEIRTGYFDARQDDSNGISTGPFAYDCAGLGAALSAVFVAADPALLSMRWRDYWITPVAVPAGSGSKYEVTTVDGSFEFWFKGDEVRFTLADGTVLECKQGETG